MDGPGKEIHVELFKHLVRNHDMVGWYRHIYKLTHLGRSRDRICLHEYLTVTMNSGLKKLLNITMKLDLYLAVVS